MRKLLLTAISSLLMASTASAQFVITRTDDTKANVSGNLYLERIGDVPTFGGVSVGDVSYITRTQNLKLTKQVKGNYFEGVKSQSSQGAANYYLILTNDELEVDDDQQYIPTTPGSVVVSLDIYAADSQDADNAVLPEGTYLLDETTAAGSADIQTTFVRQLSPVGKLEYKTVKSGSITVVKTVDGYKIDGTFVSDQGESFTIHYEGGLTFENRSSSSKDTLMIEDVDNTVFKGLTITAHGGDDKYNRYTLQLFDGTDNNGIISDGVVLNVDLFSTTPAGEDIIIADGTYKASPDYEDITEFEPMTFLSGDCYTVIGYPLYIGTYLQDMRKSAETGVMLYGYANKGTITMKRDGDKYSVRVDITTRNGVHVTGEYPMGEVKLIDKRPQTVDNKLNDDKEMVFSNDTYSYAYCTQGYQNANQGEMHDDVREFELVMNDHVTNESFMLDLILPADKTTPEGTYTIADVAADKYAPYTWVPGYYVGYTAVRKGTWAYEHYTADSTEPDIVAPATEGTIKISKVQRVDGVDDLYTVEYELKDDSDPKHTVKAYWTGRIKIYAY